MTTRARMLRRMLVWRTVATTCLAARLTSTQVNPLRTDLHTLFTHPLLRLLDFFNRIDMNTYFCCHPASIQAGRDIPCVDGGRKNRDLGRPTADLPSSPACRIYHRRE